LGKVPNTACSLTPAGRQAFADYWAPWQNLVSEMPG